MKQFVLSVFLCCCCFVAADVYTPATLPNPHTLNRADYVANPDNILSPAAEAEINALCAEAESLSEVELAVVAIGAMDSSYDAFDFAQETFNTWGIGKKNRNTGVLVLLVQDSRDIRIHTGGGIEGVLPDARCWRIVKGTMIPLLSEGKWDDGLLAGTRAIVRDVTTDAARQELLLGYHPKEIEGIGILTIYLMLCFGVLIIGAVYAYKRLNGKPRSLNNIRYQYIQDGRVLVYVLACFFPLPLLFLAIYYHKKAKEARLKPITCPECKAQMRRLSEAKENAYLNKAQQIEERVKAIDYDVWACPSCLNHLVLPYKLEQQKYSKCPQCGAKTYSQVSDTIFYNDTITLDKVKGEKTFRCKHCGYTKKKRYTIPKDVIAIISDNGNNLGNLSGGSFSGGSFGVGGFSGGSFGGGRSFGGGAGGKF